MKIIPKHVSRNFSSAVSSYDAHADLQKNAAKSLFKHISLEYRERSPSKIYEAGCGTGFLTGLILGRFPFANFAITDISDKMLMRCLEKYRANVERLGISADFAVNDLNDGIPSSNIDLFASSLAFQWVENLGDLLKDICRSLAGGGVLAFSTLGPATFANIRKAFSDLNIQYPFPNFYSEAEIRRDCGIFNSVDVHVEKSDHEFMSARHFFSHLKKIGSVNATGRSLNGVEIRKVIRNIDEANIDSVHGQSLTVEYEIFHCICRK